MGQAIEFRHMKMLSCHQTHQVSERTEESSRSKRADVRYSSERADRSYSPEKADGS
jgi:hypothetical protein